MDPRESSILSTDIQHAKLNTEQISKFKNIGTIVVRVLQYFVARNMGIWPSDVIYRYL